MKRWSLSQYTSVIECSSGEILLHNSFLAAVARIPFGLRKQFQSFFKNGILETDLDNPHVKEVCDGGFFIPDNIDEHKIVSWITLQEREHTFELIILPHENCNFRCTYCYETFERQKMKPDVIAGLKSLVERKAKEYKSVQTKWFGGEPLLAKDIIYDLSDSFLSSCEQAGIQYSSNITTNGYFLTPEVASSLLQREIRQFQITIDGPESLHDANRHLKGGGGTYKQILNNLVQMRDSNENFFVTIRINFNDRFINMIEEFLSEISPLFAGDSRFTLSFHPIGKYGGPNDSTLDVCTAESAWLKKFELIDKTLRSGLSYNIRRYLEPEGMVCYAGKESSIVVRSDGKICKCTVALEDPRNIVGTLTRDGDLLIDRSLWNLWVKLDDKDDGKCGSCSFNASCQSRSCPLAAIDKKDPPCPFTKEDYEATVKFAAFGKPQDLIKPKLISR
jgi:uncharacterized protein